MSTPRFTAETSLYPSRRSYRTARARGPARARIAPMQDELDGDHCGNCHCKPGAKCHTDASGFCHCHPPGHEGAGFSARDPVFLTR
jgi:hypothetical protein